MEKALVVACSELAPAAGASSGWFSFLVFLYAIVHVLGDLGKLLWWALGLADRLSGGLAVWAWIRRPSPPQAAAPLTAADWQWPDKMPTVYLTKAGRDKWHSRPDCRALCASKLEPAHCNHCDALWAEDPFLKKLE